MVDAVNEKALIHHSLLVNDSVQTKLNNVAMKGYLAYGCALAAIAIAYPGMYWLALRNAGMILTSRPPDQAGELLVNSSGKMLPVWLANAIGKECLSEIRSVRAKLEDLRISDLEQLETSKLRKVELVQESSGSHLDARLMQRSHRCRRC